MPSTLSSSEYILLKWYHNPNSPFSIRPLTEADKDLPWFDFTTTTAIVTCPRWGLARYFKNLTTGDGDSRDMALEAGKVLHTGFAADRLHHLYHGSSANHDLVDDRGTSIFGADRWGELRKYLDEEDSARIALEALYTGDFYDDGSDKKRTLANLEEVLIHYCRSRDFLSQPIYANRELNFVGIENKIGFVVKLPNGDEIAYLGRVDGVHQLGPNLIVHENKTTSMNGKEGHNQWHTSHQLTGYMLSIELCTGETVRDAVVHNSKIPLPKNVFDGYIPTPVIRYERQISEFFDWLYTAYQMWKQYHENPWEAPMFTHSCFRYFRTCAFSPICQADDEEFEEYVALLNPVEHPWHPHDD